jgi:hypothetical protein
MSDFYTHVRDIPPQYGPGFPEDDAATKAAEAYVSGKGDAWRLPLQLGQLQPVSPHVDRGEAAARAEAAWKLVGNHAAVARFAARGAASLTLVGSSGAQQPRGRAPLPSGSAVVRSRWVFRVGDWPGNRRRRRGRTRMPKCRI